MFEQIEHHVEKIKRVRYGPLELDVEPGKFRALTTKEVAALKTAVSSPRGNSYAMPQEHRSRKTPTKIPTKSRRPRR
jgi:23S rRNA pseudouridine2605 synthase